MRRRLLQLDRGGNTVQQVSISACGEVQGDEQRRRAEPAVQPRAQFRPKGPAAHVQVAGAGLRGVPPPQCALGPHLRSPLQHGYFGLVNPTQTVKIGRFLKPVGPPTYPYPLKHFAFSEI